jgi:CheY-like chemotaxis protein/REP element-mobilizing transposase RayT
MQRAILVLSKDASLIEMIRSNLEEGGRYYVQGVTSVHSALAMIRHHTFDLAILDLYQTESAAAQWIHNLKAIQPELKIIIYDNRDEASGQPLLTLPVNGFINRPFFAPELSDLLRKLFYPAGSPLKTSQPSESLAPGTELMLQDSSLDDEAVTQILEQTSATAVMTFIQGKAGVKTSSMSPVIAQKITDLNASLWSNYKDCDFYLFLKAENELDACLVYSMPLTQDITLAFTYPAGSDLRRIRQETTHVRDTIIIGHYSSRGTGEYYSPSIPIEDQEFQRVERPFSEEENSPNLPNLEESGSQWVLEMEDVNPEPLPPALEEIMQSFPPLAEDLGSQPQLSDTQPIRIPPIKEPSSLGFDLAPEPQLPELKSAIEENIRRVQSSTSKPLPSDQPVNLAEEKELLPASASKEQPPEENVLASALAAQDAISRELPAPRKSCITYHCVIIPDFSHNLLTRELGEKVASLIRRHHQMNGWELLRLTIRPQYALWTVNLPVSTDPVKVVEEIKSETSELLLTSQPDQPPAAEGNSFWAAGYWILSGQDPPTGSLIKQFLNLNALKSAGSLNSAH